MTAPDDRDQARPTSVTVTGSDNSQVPVLVHGTQYNHIGQRDNDDIVIVISHEDLEVPIRPDRTQTLSVQITNHGRGRRTVSLAVEGVPYTVGRVDPSSVTVSPNEEKSARMLLTGTAAQPRAGTPTVRVRGRNVGDEDITWQSNIWKISVAARPRLRIAGFAPPAKQVSAPGIYQVTIMLANDGNTQLAGSIRVGPAGLASDRWADGKHPNGGATFDLAPGPRETIMVDVNFPCRPLQDRRWQLTVTAEADRADVDTVERQVEIRQRGLLTELGGIMARWCQRPTTMPRGALVGALSAVLLVGAWAGIVLQPSNGTATSQATLSPTTTASASTAAVLPQTRTSTTNAANAIASPPMPCDQGTTIVFLGAITGPDTATAVQYVMKYEKNRSKYVKAESAYPIHATTYDGLCPAIKVNPYAKGTSPSWWFVWYGPIPASGAATICRQLDKPNPWDCRPIPAA
jgi:hypothetical protein